MKLSSQQLEAFAQAAKTLNFSKAAKDLCITQSALSQRIQKLENRIGNALFSRGMGEIRLTSIGERLLRYCTAQTALEQEFLMQTALGYAQKLMGSVRIAGFSTIMESLILPQMGTLLQKHPLLHLELHSLELRELLPCLESSVVDFILTANEIHRPSIECLLIGYEQNVLIQSASANYPDDVFLDHDKEDIITTAFWQQQQKPTRSWRTHYLDNIHLIITGVKQGLGRAIVPLHLVNNDKDICIDYHYNSLKTPIFLARFKSDSRTKLHLEIWNTIQEISHFLL